MSENENVTPEEENKLNVEGVEENRIETSKETTDTSSVPVEEAKDVEEEKVEEAPVEAIELPKEEPVQEETAHAEQAKTTTNTTTDEESWYCEKCGEKNVGNFCCKCGHAKPKPKVQKVKKEHKILTLPRVITCVLALFIGMLGGYVGGCVAGNIIKEDVEEMISENNSSPFDFSEIPGFSYGGNNNDDNNNATPSGPEANNSEDEDSSSSVPFAKAAIGVTVKQDSSVGYSGCTITAISEDSHAEEAGLEVGDIISEIDGEEMTSYSDIQSVLSTKEAGDTITIIVIRDGKEVSAKVELINSGTAQ